ncbi:MAG: UbiA family prenyltransferase [Bacteroidales bacterium]
MSLAVTLTALVGFIILDHTAVVNMVLTFIGVFLVAGGASALNQYQERRADSMMERTRHRPIPSGAMRPLVVLEITIIMIIAGLMILIYLSWITALLGVINVILYNLVYTSLKRITYLAIIPGSLVGAIPPLMGWCAARELSIRYYNIYLIHNIPVAGSSFLDAPGRAP